MFQGFTVYTKPRFRLYLHKGDTDVKAQVSATLNTLFNLF